MVAPVTFTSSAGTENNIASSYVSMPDISASIGSEENRLLQNEVATLTHDMHAVSQRLQATQEGKMCTCVFVINLYLPFWRPSFCDLICLKDRNNFLH